MESNGFGSWPGPEASASGGDFLSLRQNLTALVEDEKFNPWQRAWWGGTPPGWPDRIHTARSGLCLTREGFVGYFYGGSIAAEDLGGAMIAARCTFGVHLDMNPGHVGFEFYNVGPQGMFPPLDHPLRGDSEAEGTVPDVAGLAFRTRRMIRGMGGMLFPRYIQRQARDFFYLTARAVLPGARLDAGPYPLPGEGVWREAGLPQHGQPFALASTWTCLTKHDSAGDGNCARVRVVRVNPRTVRPEASEAPDSPTVVAFSVASRGPQSLWWKDGALSIDGSSPGPQAVALMAGVALGAPAATTASAAIGIQDEDGMLAWVELPSEVHPDARSAAAMDDLLVRLGCTARLALPGESHALLGGLLDASGDRPAPQTSITVRLVRGHAPDAHRIFESTPIVPFDVWQPLQAKRVRYMAKPPVPSTRAARRVDAAADVADANVDRANAPEESSP